MLVLFYQVSDMLQNVKEKIETYIKEHPKQKEGILFFLYSSVAGFTQVVVHLILDLLLKHLVTPVNIWPFGRQALGTFLAFLISNIVGKTVSFIMNRKKTFEATGNVTLSAVGYFVMCVLLIIAESIVGAPLQNWCYRVLGGKVHGAVLSTLSAENPVLYQICALISQGIYGTVDWIIVFFMDKYVFMKKK